VSRLADTLMGMDESRASRPGLGGLAHLGESVEPRRQWRIVGTLVILVLMGALAAGIMLRPHATIRRSVVTPAPVAVAASAAQPVRPVPVRDRVAGFMRDGVEAAKNGRQTEAAAAFRKASELDPTDGEAWNSLGVVLVRAGDTAKGVEAFRRALRATPRHPEAHRNLAVALDRQDRGAEAARHYRAFLSQSAPSDPARLQVLVRLHELGGRGPGE
jgi:predicted TPR repeat methyltransferase